MIFVRLRENLGLRLTAGTCEIHGPRGIKILDPKNEYGALLRRLFDNGISVEESAKLTESQRALLQTLSDKGLLRRFEADYSRDEIWASHYVADARQSLKQLRSRKILIVGCGGTGAIIADHLARAGVGHFVLVDGAHLDAPDLNRQWTYTREDIGAKKVELLATHLKKNFDTQVKTFHRQIEVREDFNDLAGESADLIVCAADQPQFVIEKLILDLAETNNTPLIFGSVGITDDFVGPVLEGSAQRQAERLKIHQQEKLGIDVHIARGSLCFTNTLAAVKIGLTAYRFLLGLPIALFPTTPA